MSEESKLNTNILIAVVAVISFTTGWFVFGNSSIEATHTTSAVEATHEVTPAAVTAENEEVGEEVIVVADPENLPTDEELDNAENAE